MNRENNREGRDDILKIIISGGGTGGHISPAVSVASTIKELRPDAQILFVGAERRMEMQQALSAGYQATKLPVAGFDRKHLWKNVTILLKLAHSQWKARSIIRQFRPQVAVGVGGYTSGPTLKMAGMMGVPTLIQEQNLCAGVTNRLLTKEARRTCVAYDGIEKLFPGSEIVMTGNSVRQNLLAERPKRKQTIHSFGLDPGKKTILVLGRSLGACTINNTLIAGLQLIRQTKNIQFIWQTEKICYQQVTEAVKITGNIPSLYVTDSIKDTTAAYVAADLIISRAGAGSISEFCLLDKAAILVPSPNVAEDHQIKDALVLVSKRAAVYVKDAEAEEKLLPVALETIADFGELKGSSENITHLALPDSAIMIAKKVVKLTQQP